MNLRRRIGCRLQRLVIYSPFEDEPDSIVNVINHCRNLSSISVEGLEQTDIAAIATFLISYGDQLEYALLCHMKEGQLSSLAAACPNTHFQLQDFGVDFPAAGLYAIGPRLEAITIWRFETSGTYVEWANAWGKCTDLRELYINSFEVADVEATFSTPKEQLKVLQLSLRHDSKDVKKVMDICAKGTKLLQQFVYDGPLFYRDASRTLFEKNRASLASIVMGGSQYEGDKKLDDLLGSLLKLPVLEELVLKCEMPPEILKTLGKRGIHWKSASR